MGGMRLRPHRRRGVWRLPLLVGLAVTLTACTSLGLDLPWRGSASRLTASGTLEADETRIAPRVTAAITALPLAEGDSVAAGALVARLDDRAIQLQIRQAPDIASRLTFELQAQDYVLTSPVSGIVTRVPGRVGEMAFPGQTLLAVADLSTLRLTLFIEEADLARVRVGQRVAVIADPYPARAFEGVVTSINQQAEFTPRNVQTRTDRLNLVFGVQLTVPNPDGALRPGMPVDATFAPLEASR